MSSIQKTSWIIGLSCLFLCACARDEMNQPVYYSIPAGFDEPHFPPDNLFSDARFELGRSLFYDPVLSVDSSISCASCHRPEFAFTDRKTVSEGVFGRAGTRNAPSLANVAYQPYFLREGGVPTLEMQIGVPIQEHNEFDHNLLVIAEKLMRSDHYRDQSLRAYGRLPDPFVITRSIACFERALISGQSAYDRFLQGDIHALSPDAQKGMKLFHSEPFNCSKCHSGILFTNHAFENNGLYEQYADEGRKRLTGLESDAALFKVPSLRNVDWTMPYMHDGKLSSLEDVIDHYAAGGRNHPHKSVLVAGFPINDDQKRQLLAFLKSLTDHQFIDNRNFRLP
ncbi:MAG TPA: cytochrome c peroxidase [Saprospiraceae bacterium]|nr:cytochrome c peroxidase [Saprospiraceae bacterium]